MLIIGLCVFSNMFCLWPSLMHSPPARQNFNVYCASADVVALNCCSHAYRQGGHEVCMARLCCWTSEISDLTCCIASWDHANYTIHAPTDILQKCIKHLYLHTLIAKVNTTHKCNYTPFGDNMHACSLHAIRVKQITLYSMFRNMYIATKRKIIHDRCRMTIKY